MKGTSNLCDTFLCNLNSGSTQPIGSANLPFDMCVFIHHIYRTLLSPTNVSAKKSEMVEAIRYVATLYNGTGYDKQVGDRLAKIVQAHVSAIKSDTVTNIMGNPTDWGRANDLTIQSPAYKINDNSGANLDLEVLLRKLDNQASNSEYQRILAKKVSLYNLSVHEMKQLALNHAATLKPTNKGSPASYWASKPASTTSTDGYYRKEADSSKLYKIVKDRVTGTTTEEEVQPGSAYHTKIMRKTDTCNDIHGTSGDNASCTRFVMDCLMGDKKRYE